MGVGPDKVLEKTRQILHRVACRRLQRNKVLGESVERVYSDTYEISVICPGIGVVNREDRPTEPRHFALWCSQQDIAGTVEKCIGAPKV